MKTIAIFAVSAFVAVGLVTPTFAHQRCDTFDTYQDAVRHCATSPLHIGKPYCGSHDRDKDGLPCECLPGGPKADDKACKNRSKK